MKRLRLRNYFSKIEVSIRVKKWLALTSLFLFFALCVNEFVTKFSLIGNFNLADKANTKFLLNFLPIAFTIIAVAFFVQFINGSEILNSVSRFRDRRYVQRNRKLQARIKVKNRDEGRKIDEVRSSTTYLRRLLLENQLSKKKTKAVQQQKESNKVHQLEILEKKERPSFYQSSDDDSEVYSEVNNQP